MVKIRIANKSDYEAVGEILRPHISDIIGRSWEECFDDPDNIFFVSGNNLAFFELDGDKVYYGHYFFNDRRGKSAIQLAETILYEMFNRAEVIKGLTPVHNLPAKWMSRKLGFSSYGNLDTIAGEMELFIMTKQDWDNRKEHE